MDRLWLKNKLRDRQVMPALSVFGLYEFSNSLQLNVGSSL